MAVATPTAPRTHHSQASPEEPVGLASSFCLRSGLPSTGTSSTSKSPVQPGGGATGTATGRSLCFFFFLRQRWEPCLLWRLRPLLESLPLECLGAISATEAPRTLGR